MAEAKVILTADARGLQSGARQAVASINDVETALGKLQSMAGRALSFVGLGLGAKELIDLADSYGSIISRLQLATQYTGDFAQVQAALRRAADDTRAPLQETVDLYTKLAPALQSIGRTGTASVGIIATVNKAIALSGASSEASAASMVQFSQALGSGVLRGDELNSILEQTPGLADAIAEGLGVTRGELRKMGEEGKLSSVAVIQALEKVKDRVDRDFEKLPTTVGQAFTYLMNAMTDVVGGSGQATGAMNAMAAAIKHVADGFKDFANSSQGFLVPLFALIIDSTDGVARVFRILGITVAATAARIVQSLKGNFDVAGQIRDEANQQIEAIMLEPQWKDKQAKAIVASEKDVADQRLRIAKSLTDEITKLENLKLFAAGKASEAIIKDDKARTEEQLKNAEKLKEALQKAWESTREEAKKAGEEATKLFEKAADVRQSAQDKASAIADKGLAPAEANNKAIGDFQDAAQKASFNQALAEAARLDGRTAVSKKAADQAAKDAERAMKFAEKITDDNFAQKAIEQAGDLQAKVIEAQAKQKQQEQADLTARAEAQAKMLVDLDAQITELQKKANSIQVQADITQAEAKITGLKAQLDALKDKTVTVTVNTVNSGAAAPNNEGNNFANFWSGGWTGPGGKFQPAGIVHAGEYVLRQEVVRQPGALAFLARLNQVGLKALQGYASGGLVGRLPLGAALAGGSKAGGVPVNLYIGGTSYPMNAAADVVATLKHAIGREALRKGGR